MVKSSKKRDMGVDRAGPPPRRGTQVMADDFPSDLEGPILGDILQAITTTRKALETKINTLGSESRTTPLS
ncbi:hypothetical protein NDU88_006037 [Pleurodeles waltl]|uniref:Uncharacterized protein n=1 Tax=Pleurodeles waltl TaxID=8319 RepID=A0AAV7PH66_PLEWA|nr:hypothetical protein NDU88_006037 [Pleurodeles waltl]